MKVIASKLATTAALVKDIQNIIKSELKVFFVVYSIIGPFFVVW